MPSDPITIEEKEELLNLVKDTINMTFSGKWEEYEENISLSEDLDQRITKLFNKPDDQSSSETKAQNISKINDIAKKEYLDKLSNRNFIDLFKHMYHQEYVLQKDTDQ